MAPNRLPPKGNAAMLTKPPLTRAHRHRTADDERRELAEDTARRDRARDDRERVARRRQWLHDAGLPDTTTYPE
jgi:hypothetical protein